METTFSMQKPRADLTSCCESLRYQVLEPNLYYKLEYFSIIEMFSVLVCNTTNSGSWRVEDYSKIVLKPCHFLC